MSKSYQDYLNNKSLPKLIKLIKEKNVTREQLILFLNKEGETVYKKEKTDDIIKRINAGYAIEYVKLKLPSLKAKAKTQKAFDITKPIEFKPYKMDESEYNKMLDETPSPLKMRFNLTEKGLWGTQYRFMVLPTKQNLYSYSNFFNDSKLNMKATLSETLKRRKGIKFALSYVGLFAFGDSDNVGNKNFKSKVYTAINVNDISKNIGNVIADIEKEIQEFVQHGSGWIFQENVELSINIYRYKPIQGSSYIDLPKCIKYMQACINIKNDDMKCFLWCVIAHELKIDSKKNPERVHHYKKLENNYDDVSIHYPMTLSQIPRFEKKFNKAINVYAYDLKFDKFTEKQEANFYPIYLSTSIVTHPDQCINLLLVRDGEKSHYVYIKSMSRLLYSSTGSDKSHNQTHICPVCFKIYQVKEKLINHLQNGCAKYGEKTTFPDPAIAKEYVQFKSIQKQHKNPYVIYADFESILSQVEVNDQSNTQKYQKHIPCGYAYKVVSSNDKFDKPLKLFRAENNDVNVASHFINALLDEANELSFTIMQNTPIIMTHEDVINFNTATHCHICKKEFTKTLEQFMSESEENLTQEEVDKRTTELCKILKNKTNSHIKVRDHDHLTGKYRGPAHQYCNLKYGVRHIKIPVIFHNLRGYDSHLIIKAFEKSNVRVSCIPQTSEKFLSFTIGNLQFIDSLSFIQSSLEKLVRSNINITPTHQNSSCNQKKIQTFQQTFLFFIIQSETVIDSEGSLSL